MYKIKHNFTDISGATRYLVEIEPDYCVYFKFKTIVSEEEVQKMAERYVESKKEVEENIIEE